MNLYSFAKFCFNTTSVKSPWSALQKNMSRENLFNTLNTAALLQVKNGRNKRKRLHTYIV